MTNTADLALISADSHVIEPPDLFAKRLPAALQERAPKLQAWEGGSAWLVEGAEPAPLPLSAVTGSGYRLPNHGGPRVAAFEQVLPAMYEPAARLQAQDMDSVSAEVLYPFPALWDEIKALDDAEMKLACVRAYNDWIAEFSAHSPERLIGLGKIPTTSREDALAELLRCVDVLKLKGVILDAWPGGSAAPGDPSDDPFWEIVNDRGIPVSIHYALGTYAGTSAPSGIAPGLQPPMADVALPLVASGLFDRCPNVRVVFAHGNAGWALHWLEFMDIQYVRSMASRKYTLQKPDTVPSDYIRHHFFFTIQHDRTAVKNRQKLGTAHLLWASHLPLDGANWPDNREQAMHVTDEMPADERRGVLGENAARLYRLPGYENGLAGMESEQFASLVYF